MFTDETEMLRETGHRIRNNIVITMDSVQWSSKSQLQSYLYCSTIFFFYHFTHFHIKRQQTQNSKSLGWMQCSWLACPSRTWSYIRQVNHSLLLPLSCIYQCISMHTKFYQIQLFMALCDLMTLYQCLTFSS